MAVPFYIPDEDEAASAAGSEVSNASSAANTVPNTPTRPIAIPLQASASQSPQSPQYSPIDNEVLVQAFYEALCRCSQEMPGFSISGTPTPSSLPSSPFARGHFQFPSVPPHLYSPSPSNVSSPRNSFRGVPRRRLSSYGSQSQYSQHSDEIIEEHEGEASIAEWERHYQQREQLEEFQGRVPQPKAKQANNQKPDKKPKREENKGKIATFVISALQYVIDTLR